MANLDAQTEQYLRDYAADVCGTLGEACVGVVLYGSAAGVDWVAGRSDLNTVVIVRRVSVAALDGLAAVLARWRGRGFALPVILDDDQVERAAQLFPMELDDIRRQHRVLAGRDPFAVVTPDDPALRRECAQEAFGKLLRLRAFYLAHAADPARLEQMMVESVKSFLIVARHLLRLRGDAVPDAYEDALAAAERAVGALPAMRRVLAQRSQPVSTDWRGVAAEYVDEVERLVAAVTAYGA